jgi:hypothetical protein
MKYLILPLLLIAFAANSQTIDVEKTFDVSKEAQKGFIHLIRNNEKSQQLEVYYRVRAKKDQMKFIGYAFDYNFNLVSQNDTTIYLDKGIPSKYRPKRYKGETFDVEGLYVEPNFIGNLVLKHKVTHYSWNWFAGRYTDNVSVEGKLKAKTDDDKKLFYHGHIDDGQDGTAMILAGEKGGGKENPLTYMENFHFLKYDISLNKLADVTINFETPQAIAATYGFTDDDDRTTDYVVVFAATKIPRYVGGGKFWGKDPTEYTYVRVSYDGKLIDRIKFNSPGSLWRIDEFVKDGNNVYFYGPANDEKEEYYVNRQEVSGDKTKWPAFQLAKVDNGKMGFITATTMDEFKSKIKAQPDGKKGDPYSGRRVKFDEAIVSPIGDIILAGQNYGLAKNGKGQVIGREYEDLIMFHFDKTGKLVSEYTMNKKKSAMAPDVQMFEFSNDGKFMYWTFFDNIDTKQVKELDVVIDKPLGMPKMAKIDLGAGTFAKYSEYGKGDNFAHYGGILNYLKFSNTNQVNYLGENKKGSSLWFARVNLDK